METIKNQITYLGYYQIIGGAIGLALILWYTIGAFGSFLAFAFLSLYLLMSLPFLLSVYAGYQCIRLKSNALKWSFFNQILQLLHLGFGAFAFQYRAGIYLGIGFDFTHDLIFQFSIGYSAVNFSINPGFPQDYMMVNLVALLLIIFITKLEIKVAENESGLKEEMPPVEVLDTEL